MEKRTATDARLMILNISLVTVGMIEYLLKSFK